MKTSSTWVASATVLAAIALISCGGGSSGTGGSSSVNNCSAATATDDTAMSAVTINFGGTTGFVYSPNCIKVKAGTVVTFAGDFTMHPLVGGTIANGAATPAAAGSTPLPTSPMGTGTTAMFTMQPAGTYGFYCNVHGLPLGMDGAIIVQ